MLWEEVKIKVVDIELFKRKVLIFVGSHEAFKMWMAHLHIPKSWERLAESIQYSKNKNVVGSYWYNKNDGNGIIELPKYPKYPTEIATAAHEALHAVLHMMHYVGIPVIPGDSNEAYTYCLELLIENILEEDDYETLNF